MTFTITFGWWIVPTIITIAFLVWAIWPAPRELSSSYWAMDVESLFSGFFYFSGMLISWVVYLAIHAIWGVV